MITIRYSENFVYFFYVPNIIKQNKLYCINY